MKIATSSATLVGLAIGLAACSPKSSSDPSAASGTATSVGTGSTTGQDTSSKNGTTTGADTGDGASTVGLAAVDDVADLKLSDLVIALPAALSAQEAGGALALTAAKRSADACQLGQSISEVTDNVASVAGFACHIEAEKEKIAFGKKYKIVFNGEEFGRVFVEKTASSVTFAMCGDNNSELITISSITEVGPVGTIHSANSGHGDNGQGSSKNYLSFDLGQAGRQEITAKQTFTEGENLFRRFVEVMLDEAGVSTVKLASSGTWQGNSFSQKGAAKFNGSFGATLFKNIGTHDGGEFSRANRSFFTPDGQTTAATDSAEFSEGGSLFVAPTDVPEFLTESETIPSASGWVGDGCPDFDEIVELDPESSAHQACEREHGEHASCYGDDFEYGEATTELD